MRHGNSYNCVVPANAMDLLHRLNDVFEMLNYIICNDHFERFAGEGPWADIQVVQDIGTCLGNRIEIYISDVFSSGPGSRITRR